MSDNPNKPSSSDIGAEDMQEQAKKGYDTAKNTAKNVKSGVKKAKNAYQNGKKAAKTAVKSGKAIAKASVKFGKLAAKAAKVAAKAIQAIAKVLAELFIAGGWIVVVVILVIAFLAVIWTAFVDLKGPQQQFGYEEINNKSEIETDGVVEWEVSKDIDMGQMNINQRNFYRYFANNSYWKIVASGTERDDDTKDVKGVYTKDDLDTTTMKQGTGTGEDIKIKDYYNKESILKLPSNLLYALDERMFRDVFRYPEQFIQPVKTKLPEEVETLADLHLESLTNDSGILDTWAIGINEQGLRDKTIDKIRTVSQNGLAPIFTYFEDTKENKQIARVSSYEVINLGSSKETTTKETIVCEEGSSSGPCDENIVVIYDVKDIYVMEKAVTSVGDWFWEFKRDLLYKEPLLSQIGTSKEDKTDKWNYEHFYHCFEYETYINDDGEEITSCISSIDTNLKAFKDGAIYDELPVPHEEDILKLGTLYLEQYITYFEAQIPPDVVTKSDFLGRMGNLTNSNITVGLKLVPDGKGTVGSEKYRAAVQEVLEQWGVTQYMDADMVLAQMYQESSAKANKTGGLMQLDWHPEKKDPTIMYKCFSMPHSSYVADAAKGETLVNGKLCVGINQTTEQMKSDKLTDNQNIRVGIAELLGAYFNPNNGWNGSTGDIAKALTAYNLGQGTVDYIRETFPFAWDTSEWMAYRDIARYEKLWKPSEMTGDGWYVEHVTSYYPNDPSMLFFNQLDLLEAVDDDDAEDPGLGFGGVEESSGDSKGDRTAAFFAGLKDKLFDFFDGVGDMFAKIGKGFVLSTDDTIRTLYLSEESPVVLGEILVEAVAMDLRSRNTSVSWEERFISLPENQSYYFWESNFEIPMGAIFEEGVGANFGIYDKDNPPIFKEHLSAQGTWVTSTTFHPIRSYTELISKYPEFATIGKPLATGKMRLTSPAGMRTLNGVTKLHIGVDIGRSAGRGQNDGDPLIAVADGYIEHLGEVGGYGHTITVRMETASGKPVRFFYAHLEGISSEMSLNKKVKKGDFLGTMGKSGGNYATHLHYEIKFDGFVLNPQIAYPESEWQKSY